MNMELEVLLDNLTKASTGVCESTSDVSIADLTRWYKNLMLYLVDIEKIYDIPVYHPAWSSAGYLDFSILAGYLCYDFESKTFEILSFDEDLDYTTVTDTMYDYLDEIQSGNQSCDFENKISGGNPWDEDLGFNIITEAMDEYFIGSQTLECIEALDSYFEANPEEWDIEQSVLAKTERIGAYGKND